MIEKHDWKKNCGTNPYFVHFVVNHRILITPHAASIPPINNCTRRNRNYDLMSRARIFGSIRRRNQLNQAGRDGEESVSHQPPPLLLRHHHLHVPKPLNHCCTSSPHTASPNNVPLDSPLSSNSMHRCNRHICLPNGLQPLRPTKHIT